MQSDTSLLKCITDLRKCEPVIAEEKTRDQFKFCALFICSNDFAFYRGRSLILVYLFVE